MEYIMHLNKSVIIIFLNLKLIQDLNYEIYFFIKIFDSIEDFLFKFILD